MKAERLDSPPPGSVATVPKPNGSRKITLRNASNIMPVF